MENEMRRVIVTGAGRGLGLEFTRQLLARGDRVIAGCRDPQRADALHALASAHPDRLQVRTLDVAAPASITTFAEDAMRVFDAIDLLINNAGKLVPGERFGTVTADALASSLQTNTVGPFLLTQVLAPLLAKGDCAIVANISSQLGSIARTDSFYTPSYAISKAALNMATVLLAHGLSNSGVRVIAFHPGWVKTDMGGMKAPIEPTASVTGMLNVLSGLKMEDSGTFVDYLGHPLPW
jgi:NAD(P)-dependent dehydrogenase (short-subunit alcohol dehydrogenase family)